MISKLFQHSFGRGSLCKKNCFIMTQHTTHFPYAIFWTKNISHRSFILNKMIWVIVFVSIWLSLCVCPSLGVTASLTLNAPLSRARLSTQRMCLAPPHALTSSPSPFLLGGVSEHPFSSPCCPLSLSSSLSSCLSSPTSLRRPSDIFRFDRPFYCTSDPQTPPPLPPKPTLLSDPHGNEDTIRNQTQPALLPRRTSLSGIDHVKRGENAHTKKSGEKILLICKKDLLFNLMMLIKK